MKKEKISKTSYEKASILGSSFKAEHLEAHGFIKRETLPKVFYYEFCKVLIYIDICIVHTISTPINV